MLPLSHDWISLRKNLYEYQTIAVRKVLLSRLTAWQHVTIADTWRFGRMLLLNNEIQSCEGDEFIYHEALVHPALCIHEKPRSALILGGGEGAVLREVLRYGSIEKAVMVDIDEELLAICAEMLPEWSLGSFRDKRAEVICRNAWDFLSETASRWDIIICDLSALAPTFLSFPPDDQTAYELIRSRLEEGGICAIQMHSVNFPDMRLFCHYYHRLRHFFAGTHPYHVFVPSLGSDLGFALIRAESSRWPGVLPAKRIRENLPVHLRFYDPGTHRAMFSWPRYMRDLMKTPR